MKEKPWISEGIKPSIKIRNKLFQTYHKNKPKENENKLLFLIRKSETDYYKEQITCRNNSSNLTWNFFGQIQKNKQNTVQITKLKYQDKTLTKPQWLKYVGN